jgi:hypothetical protein
MLPVFARIALAFSRQPGIFIQLLTGSRSIPFFRRWQQQVNDDSEDTSQR